MPLYEIRDVVVKDHVAQSYRLGTSPEPPTHFGVYRSDHDWYEHIIDYVHLKDAYMFLRTLNDK